MLIFFQKKEILEISLNKGREFEINTNLKSKCINTQINRNQQTQHHTTSKYIRYSAFYLKMHSFHSSLQELIQKNFVNSGYL